MADRARERGESPPTVDELLDFVVAPLYFRALFRPPPDNEDALRLVDRLTGLGKRARAHRATSPTR